MRRKPRETLLLRLLLFWRDIGLGVAEVPALHV
jgi:hypothetical protein